ncbi:MAG: ribosomal-protein-alanine N-acetyltransferase [Neisseriaceae bacterium]|nr:MAG: ribosomal-protein-alanine N-acetyltransferase [Neisseriaceae bacterium]
MIRKIQLSDLEFIHRIDQSTNPHPWSLGNIQSSIQHYLGYVYLHQNNLVSFLLFANQLDYTEILLLATEPKHQNQHFASQLINCLVEYNKRANIYKILLEVRQSNSIALQFYQRKGFTYLDTRRNYYQSPIEDALILKKNVRF